MPYLNDVKIIASLAIQPELSLTNSGREYCNFMVRLVYKSDQDETMEDFIRITAYDYVAESLVRDCKMGDLLVVVGYLAQMKWTSSNPKDASTNSRIIVIANNVERLAKANGELPPVPKDYLSMRDYNPVAMNDGEDFHVSSLSMRKAMKAAGNSNPSSYMMYPQPKPDGKWRMPTGRMNAKTQKWVQNRIAQNATTIGIDGTVITAPVAMPTTANPPASRNGNYTQRQQNNTSQRGVVSVATNTVTSQNAIAMDSETGMPLIPKNIVRIAERFVPFFMRSYSGWLTLPDGKKVKYQNYINISKAQEKELGFLSPVERRQLAMAVMMKNRGKDFGIIDKLKLVDSEIVNMRNVYAAFVRGQHQRQQQQQQAVVSTTATATATQQGKSAPAVSSLPVSGGQPNDWYQDESGEWHRR